MAEAKQAFAEGDVVQLASGGPKMTVVDISGMDRRSVQCMWFNDAQQTQQAPFRPEWLRKAEGKK